jgi:CAAX protease family protein
MRFLLYGLDLMLAAYIGWEVAHFPARYRRLKQAVADGEMLGRIRLYRRMLFFEWSSAFLALFALGFDWNHLNPKLLGLEGSRLLQFVSPGTKIDQSTIAGVLFGFATGTIGFLLVRLKIKRRGTESVPPLIRWLRKVMPDFSALIPLTVPERLLWIGVAASAGICEEIVFRGWLLATLHERLTVSGTPLVLLAALLFGLAHIYQGSTGVALTTFAGIFFCGLYVMTGSLLLPILLHALVDVRFAVLPAPRAQLARVAYT